MKIVEYSSLCILALFSFIFHLISIVYLNIGSSKICLAFVSSHLIFFFITLFGRGT